MTKKKKGSRPGIDHGPKERGQHQLLRVIEVDLHNPGITAVRNETESLAGMLRLKGKITDPEADTLGLLWRAYFYSGQYKSPVAPLIREEDKRGRSGSDNAERLEREYLQAVRAMGRYSGPVIGVACHNEMYKPSDEHRFRRGLGLLMDYYMVTAK